MRQKIRPTRSRIVNLTACITQGLRDPQVSPPWALWYPAGHRFDHRLNYYLYLTRSWLKTNVLTSGVHLFRHGTSPGAYNNSLFSVWMGRYGLHHYSRRRSGDVYSRLYECLHRDHGGRGRVLVHAAVVVSLGIRDVVDRSI